MPYVLLALLMFFCPLAVCKETICLNMIVKNESDVICRCLDSVKSIIDYWVIVDTGSTDGTQELIKNHMLDIPGELHERPWKNFGFNRTEALELAKGKADYILVIDADDTLIVDPNFQLTPPNCDAYTMWRGPIGTTYEITQIIKSSLPWRWEGVLHEYLVCGANYSSALLTNVRYLSASGGARSKDPEKFLKAAQILEDGLLQEPNNSRYIFYLGESYRDAGIKEKAIEWYQKRVQLGGWNQEVFWSLFQIGQMKCDLNYPLEEVIECFARAHRYRPHRVEPIYCLAEIYNKQRRFDLAYACLKSRDFIPTPNTKDSLFNLDWMAEYGTLFQLSICSYYLGRYKESLDASNALLAMAHVPESWRSQIQTNRNFALAKIGPSPDYDATPHELFSIAQFLQCTHQLPEALQCFQRRAANREGPEEEIFTSMLNIAKIQDELNMSSEMVIEAYERAHHYAPLRIEPLFYLTKFYSRMKLHTDAYYTALEALKLLKPHQESSAEAWIYEYGMLWEFSLSAHSIGKFEEAIDAAHKILNGSNISASSRKTLEKNLFYFSAGVEITKFAKQKWKANPVVSTETWNPPQQTRLHVCTIASEECQNLAQLRDSCKVHEVSLDVLGLNLPWSGLGLKLIYLQQYLDTLPDDDVVMMVDGYDTLVLADEKTILEGFRLLNVPCLFSTEANCHPFPHFANYYPSNTDRFKFLNSGTLIGYVGYLKTILKEVSPISESTDDQGLMSCYHIYHPGKIMLDTGCKLFLTLYQVGQNEIVIDKKQKRVFFPYANTFPCVIHGNGEAKILYQYIYDQMFSQPNQLSSSFNLEDALQNY